MIDARHLTEGTSCIACGEWGDGERGSLEISGRAELEEMFFTPTDE